MGGRRFQRWGRCKTRETVLEQEDDEKGKSRRRPQSRAMVTEQGNVDSAGRQQESREMTREQGDGNRTGKLRQNRETAIEQRDGSTAERRQ